MAEDRRVNAVARTVWMAAAAVALAAARPAPGAAPPAPTPDAVSVTILGIHATNKPEPYIHPALQPIANELRRSKYNSFDLVASQPKTLSAGENMKFPMEGYELQVTVEKITADAVQLAITWSRQGRVLQQVRMALRKGKYFLTGGWELKDGALLAAIAAR